ncbi:hypothetical protein [Thiosocius teredinicola]|uniref:hypothetical protein n=1 Tax=Thiosocius teredinicola TaxID=1973002 RepID=UPI000F796404
MRYFGLLIAMVCVGLLGLPAAVVAEPAGQTEPQASPNGDVWGDPEDNEGESSDESWTWFGMGYERRRAIKDVTADGTPAGDSGSPGNNPGKPGK